MIIPAEAAPAREFDTVNMLDGSLFYFVSESDNSTITFGEYSTPRTVEKMSGHTLTWKWEHDAPELYWRVFICIYGDKPDSLSLKVGNISQELTFEYTEGAFYHYYSADSYATGSAVSLIASYSSGTKHRFDVLSCIGYFTTGVGISSWKFGSTLYHEFNELWDPVTWSTSPNRAGLSNGSYADDEVTRGRVLINIAPENRHVDDGYAVTALFHVAGIADFSAVLLDQNGDIISVLDDIVIKSVPCGVGVIGSYENTRNFYSIHVDLSDYDVSDYTVQLQCEARSETGYSEWGITFRGAIWYAPYEEPSFLNTIIWWINNGVRTISSYIEYGYTLITDNVKEGLGIGADTSVINDVNEGSSIVSDAEGQYIAGIEENTDVILDTFDFQFVSVSLAFVATYFNKAFLSLGSYSIVFLLPLAIAWILFLLNRVTPSMAPRIKYSSDRSTNQTE